MGCGRHISRGSPGPCGRGRRNSSADVTPFEHMKLRLLNGAHSTIAYLGYLAGNETVAATIAEPAFAAPHPRHDGR